MKKSFFLTFVATLLSFSMLFAVQDPAKKTESIKVNSKGEKQVDGPVKKSTNEVSQKNKVRASESKDPKTIHTPVKPAPVYFSGEVK